MRASWLAVLPSLMMACQLDTSGLGSGNAGVGSTAGESTGDATDGSGTTVAQTSVASADGGTSASTSTDGDASADGTTTGTPADCAPDNGGCDPNATCDASSGQIECTCNPGYAGDGLRCSVDATLPTLRLEIPCQAGSCGDVYCEASGSEVDMAALDGNPAVSYAVTLRVRGVVEEKQYFGGTNDGFWNEGGTPNGDVWNVYSLEISDPPQTYYLNSGMAGVDHCVGLDYEQTVPIASGATVTLAMSDSNQCATQNVDDAGEPITIPRIPPAPDAFDGQFLQVDASEVVPM